MEWHLPAPVSMEAVAGPKAGSILVYWEPPPATGGHPISYYTVKWAFSLGGSLGVLPTNAPNRVLPVSSLRLSSSSVPAMYNPEGVAYYAFTIKDLPTSEHYLVSVEATNTAGYSSEVKKDVSRKHALARFADSD